MNRAIIKWLYTNKIHIIIWVLFIFYESFVIGLIVGKFGNPITYIGHYTIILSLFYCHSNIALPWAMKHKIDTYWRLPLIIILQMGLYIICTHFVDRFLFYINAITPLTKITLTYQSGLKSLYRGLYFLGFSSGYYFLITYLKERKKTEVLERQRLNNIINQQKTEKELATAQNAFLRAQISPHFLFNTLDFVYHNIYSLSEVAGDAIITLSDMMRYSIDSDKMGDFINLQDELIQAENLIYLFQLRKNHELGIKFNYSDEIRELKFIPLVLLTLVENIFKHGNLSPQSPDALIDIYIKDETFILETSNSSNQNGNKNGLHSGLSNIEKRLKYAYGNEITFHHYTDNSSIFKVQIQIPVTSM